MQNRYVGDIGDYFKLAILRTLAGDDYSLGIAWWLVPDESHNADGKHTDYLKQRDKWRDFEPQVFDSLKGIVDGGHRTVAQLETLNLLPNARFSSEPLFLNASFNARPQEREEWFSRVVSALKACDLVFLDPDNGLEPNGFSLTQKSAIKSISFDELKRLRRTGRSILVYHHHTRFKGGHACEIKYQAERLKTQGFERIAALRITPYSPRALFLLDGDDRLDGRAVGIAEKWNGHLQWFPAL
jgi:hypothetical protein